MTAPLVVTAGESMALLSSPEVGPLRHARSLRTGMAGAESNVAIGLTRLGTPAHWTGRVGDDEFGRLVTDTLRGQGVHTTAIVDPAAPTGLMIKERRTSDTARVSYYRAGSAGSRLRADDLDENLVRAAAVLHLSGITPALSVTARDAVHAWMDLANAAGVPVSFDLNYRSALWPPDRAAPVLADLAARADIVFATDTEAALLADGADPTGLAAALAARGPSQVLVKRGAEGAVAVIDDVRYVVPPEPVVAIDQVGAGDAFTAGYLSELCLGSGPETRLRTAALVGAFAVTVHGDWEGAPSRAELNLIGGADNVHR